MTELQSEILPVKQNDDPKDEEEKSQAQLDYEAGQQFLENNDTGQAANSFHNSYLGFKEENNLHGVARAADKLGDVCMMMEKYERAREHFKVAQKICTDDYDRFSLFVLDKKLADISYKLKDYNEAISQYLDILDTYQGNNNPEGAVKTLETMAEIYIEMGEKKKAADSYMVAASIHRNFKHKRHAAKLEDKAKALE
jgi:tetratricopeptide (TPR) repeat protein